MPLLDIWQSSPDELQQKAVRQLIALAGNGKLGDGSTTSAEFRALLSVVPSKLLTAYAGECLEEAFSESGLALQDIINEIGRRLGFQVENGRYRGKSGSIGNDGLWALPNKHKVIVEVKTTDAYRVGLDVIEKYRKQLIALGHATEDQSSVLVVVGRADTGELEAQIRGSRHAWSMRLVSVDALARLMVVKESVEEPETLRRVHEILIPREFTKLDAIIDLVFSTTEDAKQIEEPEPEEAEQLAKPLAEKREPQFTPVDFNEQCAARVGRYLSASLLKRSKALFSSPDDLMRVLCLASRKHEDGRYPNYWFGFHPHQKTALEAVEKGFAAFGCGSSALIFLFPMNILATWLNGMNMTTKEDRFYWHVQIRDEDGRYMLAQKKGQPHIDVTTYKLPE